MVPGFLGIVGSVQRVSVGHMGVVSGLLVIARLVVFGRFPVMSGRVFMMIRGLAEGFAIAAPSRPASDPARY